MFYYTDSFGPDRNALGAAITRTLQLGQQTLEAVIASHQLANFEGSIISRFLSPTQYAVFHSSRAVTLNNVKVYMMTERNEVPDFDKGPVLAMHVSLKYLMKLMDDPRATHIIFVPWDERERDSFRADNPTAIAIPFSPDPGD
jgi:hypothetical protein